MKGVVSAPPVAAGSVAASWIPLLLGVLLVYSLFCDVASACLRACVSVCLCATVFGKDAACTDAGREVLATVVVVEVVLSELCAVLVRAAGPCDMPACSLGGVRCFASDAC